MRLFVAIDLPGEIKATLSTLRGGIPEARWIAAENAHVTLAFIGEVQGPMMMDISLALGQIRYPAFDLDIEGVGVFGNNRRPRLLWAGVRPSPALRLLHQKVMTAVENVGAKPDERRFHPHITLARVHNSPYEKVRRFLTDHALFRAPTLPVTNFSLFSSHPTSSGSIYHEEVSYDLLAPAEL